MKLSIFSDESFMKEALKEAQKAFEKNEVPIGAVIVSNNKIIARAHNLCETLNDATAHAEMQAITSASNFLGSKYLNECTLYVTLEPCTMCASAIAWSQIGKIVYGADDDKKGFTKISKNLLHPKTEVVSGVLEKDCSEILINFFRKKRV
ncbi:MAG: nucleoside deaminase [Bacteroidales bacterium]|nr:nucleoside deaminase [Bacteroidales bacterium]